MSTLDAAAETEYRVSTLELFFDLVFVFTITQLTSVLVGDLSGRGVLQVVLMLGVIWWMYAGYAWLTNTVAPDTAARRVLLMLGMAGFLVIALAIPGAYDGTGVAFGIGYMIVNLVHSGLFIAVGGTGVLAAMRGLGPLNLISAGLVLAGGFAPGTWRYVLWAAAMGVQIASPYLHRLGGFTIRSAHFVERHGLVVIIALGESVVAIGVGAAGLPLTLGLVATAVLGLTLVFELWWAYFGGDDARAEQALEAVAPERRARVGLHAYGYAHFPMLLGIVGLAAGVKKTIGHAFEHAHLPGALALAGGAALYLAGDVAFRWVLRIGRRRWRAAAAVAALVTVPVGVFGNAATQLAAVVLILGAMLAVER